MNYAKKLELEIKNDKKKRLENALFINRCVRMCSNRKTKAILSKCVFVEYSGNDRCSRCLLSDYATDEECAELPCENGFFRYSQDKNETKVAY